MASTLYLTGLYAQVKVGDNPLILDEASLIEIESTSKGFLPSRMTSDQRDLQLSWNTGHIIYNLSDSCLQIYSGIEWSCLTQDGFVDTTIYNSNGTLTGDRMLELGGFDLTFSGTNNVTLESTGELGLGEPNPEAPLHITESIGTPASANSGTIILEHGNDGGASSLVFKSSTDEGSDFGFIQYDDNRAGGSLQTSLLTIGAANENDLDTRDDIALLPSGNVGIGTINPDELLHVAGNMRLEGAFEDQDGDAGTIGQVLTSTATGTNWIDQSSIDAANIYNTSDGLEDDRVVTMSGSSLTFDGSSRDMIINSSGNVGIGVANPARPLHVDQALRISRGFNSTSFIFDRWNGSIDDTWASAGFFLESNSAGTGSFFISNYRQNVAGSPNDGIALAIDLATDQLSFPQYGDGNFDSTSPSRLLGINTDGDVLEIVPELDSFALNGNSLVISLNGDGVDPLTVDLSGVSGSSDNIYNIDGSLNSARTLNLNTHNLTFDGTADGDVIIQPDGDVGLGTLSPSARLDVQGGTVTLGEYGIGAQADTTNVDYILTANSSGEVKELNTAKNTRWFYPPAVVIDASDLISNATIDLHADYVDQFGTPQIIGLK